MLLTLSKPTGWCAGCDEKYFDYIEAKLQTVYNHSDSTTLRHSHYDCKLSVTLPQCSRNTNNTAFLRAAVSSTRKKPLGR
jgi:hypothetical protein